MHSEGILAGELKHGPLALVDKLMPVIMIIMRDHTYTKCQNALQQVIARQVGNTLDKLLQYEEGYQYSSAKFSCDINLGINQVLRSPNLRLLNV